MRAGKLEKVYMIYGDTLVRQAGTTKIMKLTENLMYGILHRIHCRRNVEFWMMRHDIVLYKKKIWHYGSKAKNSTKV